MRWRLYKGAPWSKQAKWAEKRAFGPHSRPAANPLAFAHGSTADNSEESNAAQDLSGRPWPWPSGHARRRRKATIPAGPSGSSCPPPLAAAATPSPADRAAPGQGAEPAIRGREPAGRRDPAGDGVRRRPAGGRPHALPLALDDHLHASGPQVDAVGRAQGVRSGDQDRHRAPVVGDQSVGARQVGARSSSRWRSASPTSSPMAPPGSGPGRTWRWSCS